MMKFLLSKGADPTQTDGNGDCALTHAVTYGQDECVQIIIDATTIEALGFKIRSGLTPIECAARHGRTEALQLLCAAGVNILDRSSDKVPAFARACHMNHLETAQYLATVGADIGEADQDENPAIHQTAGNGSIECMRLVLDMGANVDLRGSDRRTPLLFAVWRRHFDCAAGLIKVGAHTEMVEAHGRTPLMYACWNGDLTCIELLLQANANVEAVGHQGWSPMTYAADKGHVSCLSLLQRHGARPKGRDQKPSIPPLLRAVIIDHPAAVDFLASSDTLSDVCGKRRRNAVHVAAVKGHVDCLKLMLDKSGKTVLKAKDSSGDTPLVLAKKFGQVECLRLLTERQRWWW